MNEVIDEVAPHMGAWIEIIYNDNNYYCNKVAPHMGAWIEIIIQLILQARFLVAPHTGAWIEIYEIVKHEEKKEVAPHTGAWIEMYFKLYGNHEVGCRSPHGSVNWNLQNLHFKAFFTKSLPTRERELK